MSEDIDEKTHEVRGEKEMTENKYGIDNDKYMDITIRELLEIKKLPMIAKDFFPAAKKLMDKYSLTNGETLHLIHVARKFKL